MRSKAGYPQDNQQHDQTPYDNSNRSQKYFHKQIPNPMTKSTLRDTYDIARKRPPVNVIISRCPIDINVVKISNQTKIASSGARK